MFEIPMIEKLNSSDTIHELLGDSKAAKKAAERAKLADAVCDYLQADALCILLAENPRLALYIPLEELYIDFASAKLRSAYHRAWRECWNIVEFRNDYTQGDINPYKNQREGQAIVKALHLTPWLLYDGIITPLEIEEIIEDYANDEAAMRALSDCITVFNDTEFFDNFLCSIT